jgi:cell division protein FtsL
MTAPWARAATPAPRPVPRPEPRPALRLVSPPDPAAKARRRARLLTTVLAVLACAGLFAIVGLRVVLAQGQAEVDRLETRVEQVQAHHQRLRLQVAERESPAAVVAAARDRLGMVPLGPVVHLSPVAAGR